MTGSAGPGSASRRSAAPGATRGDTVHVDVVDAAGNMVSATPSGGWLQSSPTIPALGFCLGTRAQMFWLEDGLPSSLRARPAPAHDAEPLARPARRRAAARVRHARAATSRTSGSCASGSRTPSAGWTCRPRSTPRPGTPPRSRRRSRHAAGSPAGWSSSPGWARRRSTSCAAAATPSPTRASGRWAGCAPSAAGTGRCCAPPPTPAAASAPRRRSDPPGGHLKAAAFRTAHSAKVRGARPSTCSTAGLTCCLGRRRFAQDGEGGVHHHLGHEPQHLRPCLVPALLGEPHRHAQRGSDRLSGLPRRDRCRAGELVRPAGMAPVAQCRGRDLGDVVRVDHGQPDVSERRGDSAFAR